MRPLSEKLRHVEVFYARAGLPCVYGITPFTQPAGLDAALAARKGDCLIIHYGSRDDPGLALIDGGPGQVYKPLLKPRLTQIRKARGLGGDEPLSVDLLMVSHTDDDHINGILELTNELVIATDAKKPLPVKVRSFWHNTFDDIIGNEPDQLLAAVKASFGAAALSGEPDSEGLEPDAAMVLASVEQGFRLRDDARKLKSFESIPNFERKWCKWKFVS